MTPLSASDKYKAFTHELRPFNTKAKLQEAILDGTVSPQTKRIGYVSGSKIKWLVRGNGGPVPSGIEGWRYESSPLEKELASLMKVKPVKEIPLKWPDVLDAPVTAGGYWYPQGFAFDANGWLILHMAGTNISGSGYSSIVVYDDEWNYRGWFKTMAGGESILVTGSFLAGNLVIEKKGTGSSFMRLIVGSLPAKGANLVGQEVILLPSGCQTMCTREGNTLLIEQSTPEIGGTASRQKWMKFDQGMNQIGDFFTTISVVGYQLSTAPLYDFIPKAQGVALKGGHVYVATGGSWIFGAPVVAPRSSDYGIAKVSMEGTLVDYAVLDSQAFADWLTAKGYAPDRIESEGCYFHPNGGLYSLCVTLRPVSAGSDERGIVFLSHGDWDGEDLSHIRSNYIPRDLIREGYGVLPRGLGNVYTHPVTGQPIGTMTELLNMMQQLQMMSAHWFSAALPIELLPDMQIPQGNYTVKVEGINNSSYRVTVSQTSFAPLSVDEYQVYISGTTWRALKVLSDMPAIDPDRISAALHGFTSENTAEVLAGLIRVKDGTGRFRILEIGDSTTRGTGVTQKDLSRPSQLARMLKADGYPVNTQSVMAFNGGLSVETATTFDPTLSSTGGWAEGVSYVVGGRRIDLPAGAEGEFTWSPTEPVDRFEIHYSTWVTAGVMEYLIDGVVAGEINQYSAANAQTKSVITVPKGVHSLTLRRKSGGIVNFCQLLAWDSTVPAIDILNAGWNGSNTQIWSNNVNAWSPSKAGTLFEPDLTIVNLTINHQTFAPESETTSESNYKSQYQLLLDNLKPVGDVWIMIGNPGRVDATRRWYNQMAVRRWAYELAETNGLPVIDLMTAFRTYDRALAMSLMTDTLHPNYAGYQLGALVEYSAISRVM